ncbi:MAG: TIGR03085 family metal-binding protein [Micropruina sp.]|uniref:TIGR03085 family metal-binding protein n=1 Tax=Micropruina sp. TaxID=2737536 RepID=UPI0039E433FA
MPHAVNDRARAERAYTCDALLEVGPTATTLCEGWTAHDLLVHLYIRDGEPSNAIGAVVPAFAGRYEARVAELKRGNYAELVAKLRQGPPRRSLFSIPAVDAAANATEFLIHGMDVRRPNEIPEPARDEEFQAWAWSQLAGMGKLMLRGTAVPLALEWAGRPAQVVRVGKGERLVTVIGEPTELLLYAFGRRAAAGVRFVGLDEAVAEARGR